MNDVNLGLSNAKTKFILIIILYLVIAFLFYWYLLKPQFQEMKVLNNEISKQEQKLSLLNLANKRMKFLVEENKLMTARITELQKVLPVGRNDFVLGEEFLVTGKICGVTYTSLSFPKASKGQNASSNTVPFTLGFTAEKLDNVRYFFTHIYRFPQVARVNSLSIDKTKQQGTSKSVYNVSIDGEIYLSQRK